jgi:hypothetical protein
MIVTPKHVLDAIQEDNSLHDLGWYLSWPYAADPKLACLDGNFTADELEAIARHMRTYGEEINGSQV